jgi:hypothetical protein
MRENEEIIKSAFATYKKYYIRSALIEVFGKNEPLDNYKINEFIRGEMRKIEELNRTTAMDKIMIEFEYLKKTGYFKCVENETKITLSEIGLKALHECLWENLSNSAFFGYKSMVISNNSIKIATIACCITGFALLVSLCSFVFVLCS